MTQQELGFATGTGADLGSPGAGSAGGGSFGFLDSSYAAIICVHHT